MIRVDTEAGAINLSAGFFFCCASIVFGCVVPECARAQDSSIVRSVHTIGNAVLSMNDFQFSTKPGVLFSPSSLQSDLDRVLQLYENEGYLHARVDSVSVQHSREGREVEATIFLNEGKPAEIGRVQFQGNKRISDGDLRGVVQLQEGARFLPQKLEDDVRRLLKKYEDAGYPFAKISVENISFRESENAMLADITLLIEEGKSVRISELRIEGNKTTKESVIAREARIRENEVFRGDLPEKIRRRLERLQLFSTVAEPELYLTEQERGGLLVRVTEGNHNSFDGILGYIPSLRPQEQGYLTGLINVQLRNLFGTGRRLSSRWFQEDRTSQEIELHYFEPWVASYPVNAQLGFFQRKQDSTFVRSRFDLAAELMLTEELSVGGLISRTVVFPTEGYGRAVIAESQTTNIGISVQYDSRDNPATPTSGVLYRTEYQSGSKQISGTPGVSLDSKASTQRISFDVSYYVSPISFQVIAAEVHARDYSASNIDLSDLFRLGGATTLRGYRDGQFLGSRVVWSNLEYRLLVARRSFVYGFVDYGRIAVSDYLGGGSSAGEQEKIGYGIGVRLDSALGLVGVSIGFGEGDTFSTAKLHFRLINEF